MGSQVGIALPSCGCHRPQAHRPTGGASMIKTAIGALALTLLCFTPVRAQDTAPADAEVQVSQEQSPEEDHLRQDQLRALREMLNRQATPYVVGAIKLDVPGLDVATGPVGRGQSLFSGGAEHAQVGRLTAELNLRDALQNHNVPIGTPMYLVEFVSRPGGSRAVEGAPWVSTAVWCGNLDRKTIFGTPSPSLCLFDNDPSALLLGTRRAYMSLQSRPWITTSGAALPASLAATDFQIERVADQPFGPMEVRLEVSQIRGRNLRLTLFASREGDDVVLMRFNLPVADGRAVLPLWDYRLQLTVDRKSVTPLLTNDGDGSSPIVFGTYPA
jgi:hypothetical protein